MISGVDKLSPSLRGATVAAGLAAAALLAVPVRGRGSAPLLLDLPLQTRPVGVSGVVDTVAAVAAPVAAVVVGLLAVRRWPWLLSAAALLTLVSTLYVVAGVSLPETFVAVLSAARPLAVIGVFAAAQSLIRSGETRLGAVVAGAGIGAAMVGSAAATGQWWWSPQGGYADWPVALAVAALAGVAPAAWLLRGGDAAVRPAEPGSRGRRVRLVVAGGLAVAVAVPLGMLTTERLAVLIGVSQSALNRHQYAQTAVIGAIALAVVAVLTATTGPWSLGGALTVATVQVAAAAPLLLAAMTMRGHFSSWLSVLAGLALGLTLAASRWRFPLAAAAAVAAAVALLIAYVATTGHPEKLANQDSVTPAVLIAVLVTAAATAVVGASTTALAPAGIVPAALGPLAGMLAVSGLQTVDSTYFRGGGGWWSSAVSAHLGVSIWLLLAVAAAVGGLGLARQWADRRAERRLAEQIRREAAEAERNRLARPIHDGVLQVLALVQRHGAELGGTGSELAALAGEQEFALRSLLSGGAPTPPDGGKRAVSDDLRTTLTALASATVEVAAPAAPVPLPQPAASEVTAVVEAALDNVRRHAGPDARAWVLLEDEGDGVRVTVRDNGAGFEPARLAEAAGEGRLGVAQSIRGRVADLGGTIDIFSRPGQGTEVEFWVPRKR
ncbi:ATP-binding protein [Dactylosporangium sp. NPDC049525]|uniref:sensor histidine kinase n=1 Tax=Dactylosporangium sp. NPDC049525 TaxID=3154730 RepID=UPI0034123FDE